MSLTLGGVVYNVPGAFAITEVINQGGSTIPIFNVGCIIGTGISGIPYLNGIGTPPALTADEFILPFSDTGAAKAYFGDEGDSNIVTALKYAKKTGAGSVYTINVNPLTAMSGGTIANVTPVTALTLNTTLKQYGVKANDTSLTIATSIHTIIPVKNVTLLTANSGTGKTFSVASADVIDRLNVGDTIYINTNTYAAPVSKVIESKDSVAKTITVTVAIAVTALIADYARIYQEDTDNQEVSEALTTPALVEAFYATSKYASVVVAAGVTVMPVTLAKTNFQNITSATKATSPAATASDWEAITENFQRWNEEFALVNKKYIRVLNLITSDAANHASFATLATTMRGVSKPIALIAGCALGDYLLATSDAASPITRAKALNSDAIQLAQVGLDGNAAYLSMSPEIFGIRISNAITHNQTNDLLVATTVEKAYYQEDAALDTLCVNGVMAIKMTPTGFKLAQGLTTYQDHATTFNTDTKMTYLVTLRDLADFDLRLMLELLDQFVGADGVTREILSSAIVQASETEQNQLQYITSYQIQSITRTGNAWTVERTITLPGVTDFIGLINTIIVD